jgi:hypothetical protein
MGLSISRLQYPQELILSTKLNLRLIDLDLSPELMGPIRIILLETITEELISYEQILRYWYNYINICSRSIGYNISTSLSSKI